MFYTAFEAEFQAYLWQAYGARIAIMETNANWSGKPAGAPPVNSAGKFILLLNVLVIITSHHITLNLLSHQITTLTHSLPTSCRFHYPLLLFSSPCPSPAPRVHMLLTHRADPSEELLREVRQLQLPPSANPLPSLQRIVAQRNFRPEG
jgi:hypothetical protein